jgi:hypothetical protein
LCDDDFLADDELHRAVELADPELRALQVGDQGQRPADLALGLADETGALGVLLAAAVREVEPRGVDPGLDERGDTLGAARCGADRGDDFRPALRARGHCS